MTKLDSVIVDISKQLKTGTIQFGTELQKDVPRIPFSSPRLNYMTYGGVPIGRITEFFGAEGSGKTTTALDIIGNYQKLFPDRPAAFCDVEHTFDSHWAHILGVDVSKLLYIDTGESDAEQTLEILQTLLASGAVGCVVLDSIAGLISRQAYEKSLEESTYGGISRPLSVFSVKAVNACTRYNIALIALNQLRDNLKSTYGGTVTPGGRAWRHHCSMRLQFRHGNFFDSSGKALSQTAENPTGHEVECSLVKSKVSKSDRRTGFYTLNYLTGIDYFSDTIDVGIKSGIIQVAGAWYSILDKEEPFKDADGKALKFQGKAKLAEFLRTNPDWYHFIADAISESW